jgi:hypothetical protein
MRTNHDHDALPGSATLPALLRWLGVHREPLTRQVTAVKAWLADNAISPELTMSLRANGYGLLFRSERARSA